jgi:hypothetical protein
MATKTVHRSNPGADIDQIVVTLNQVVDLVNELKTVVNGHITDGKHKAAAAVDAAATLATKSAADNVVLGY